MDKPMRSICCTVSALRLAAGIALVVAATATGASGEGAEVPGFMRVDTDGAGTQLWFGATHSIGGVAISSDVYLSGPTAEVDVGPSFAVGENLTLTPMAGLILDFEATNLTTLVPQLYVYWSRGRIYLESWELAYVELQEGSTSTFNDRTFLLYSTNELLSIGPQAELWYNLEEVAGSDDLTNLAVGGRANLAYGEKNTLGLFIGYETVAAARGDGDGVVGRVTFIREW